jgi:hypothetical protein
VQSIKAFFRFIYRQWMRLAHLLGTVNKYVFLTIFYWLVVNIANLCVRAARADLLDRRMHLRPSYWHPKDRQVGSYRSQF